MSAITRLRRRERLTGLADEAASGLGEQIACHHMLGWRTLELRSVQGEPVGALPASRLDRIADVLCEADMTVPVIASRIGNWGRDIADPFDEDLAEFDRLATFGARVGTKMIRVMSYPARAAAEDDWQREVVRRLRTLAARAQDRGLVIVHENCAGWGGRSVEHLCRLAESIPDRGFALLFDMGNGPSYGYDSLEMLRAIVSRVVHVHVKDARREAGGPVRFTLPGEGECRVAECLELLEHHGYEGMYSIEPHLHVVPHLGMQTAGDDERAAARTAYAACAHAVEQLLARCRPLTHLEMSHAA
ncbi:MAG TPA: sugar phosphate isomerase/epimerase family protein [Burkholderiaceae bacterium]|nr:sugar phosphate isomerase/epimerase family protein [Burkholderiaceae bacterium]